MPADADRARRVPRRASARSSSSMPRLLVRAALGGTPDELEQLVTSGTLVGPGGHARDAGRQRTSRRRRRFRVQPRGAVPATPRARRASARRRLSGDPSMSLLPFLARDRPRRDRDAHAPRPRAARDRRRHRRPCSRRSSPACSIRPGQIDRVRRRRHRHDRLPAPVPRPRGARRPAAGDRRRRDRRRARRAGRRARDPRRRRPSRYPCPTRGSRSSRRPPAVRSARSWRSTPRRRPRRRDRRAPASCGRRPSPARWRSRRRPGSGAT